MREVSREGNSLTNYLVSEMLQGPQRSGRTKQAYHFPWRLKLAAASRDSLWLVEIKCCTSGGNRSPFPPY